MTVWLTVRIDDEPLGAVELEGPGGQILFGVGSEVGPRSGTWRIFAPRNRPEIYLGSRELMRAVKVSLHDSGDWHFAVNREVAEKLTPVGASRIIDAWRRPEPIGAGWTRAFTIWIPGEDITTIGRPQGRERSVREIEWLPNPSADTLHVFEVALGTPDRGEIALSGQMPLGGFWVERERGIQEGCLVLYSQRAIDDDGRAWLADQRSRAWATALHHGGGFDKETTRAVGFSRPDGGTPGLWDLALAPADDRAVASVIEMEDLEGPAGEASTSAAARLFVEQADRLVNQVPTTRRPSRPVR